MSEVDAPGAPVDVSEVPVDVSEVPVAPADAQVKRPRGRPRKNPEKVEEPKRPRARPRKEAKPVKEARFEEPEEAEEAEEPQEPVLDPASVLAQVLLQGEAEARRRQAERYKNMLGCLLYTSPSPRDLSTSRMPSSA